MTCENYSKSNEIAFSRNMECNVGWNDVLSKAEKTIQDKQDEYLKEMTMEILKKSEIRGSTDKIAGEFVRIFNMLKTQLAGPRVTQIPKQTVFDDYIICLEDGKKMQMLNRHLKVKYHMSFQDYKQKWGLPIDYPSTCKNYSKIRADIARKKRKKLRLSNAA